MWTVNKINLHYCHGIGLHFILLGFCMVTSSVWSSIQIWNIMTSVCWSLYSMTCLFCRRECYSCLLSLFQKFVNFRSIFVQISVCFRPKFQILICDFRPRISEFFPKNRNSSISPRPGKFCKTKSETLHRTRDHLHPFITDLVATM